MTLSPWEWVIVAAAAGGVITFILFFFWPERTAVAFLLVFSTVRHGFRVKHEIMTGKFVAPDPEHRPPAELSGTLSGYIADKKREAVARLTREMERVE